MKTKVLYWEYHNKRDNGIERIYLEPDFEQADKDLALLEIHSDRKWKLVSVDIYREKDRELLFKNRTGRPKIEESIKSLKKLEIQKDDIGSDENTELENKFSTVNELGCFLRDKRLKNELKIGIVSKLTGLNVSGIARLENGTNKNALIVNENNNTYEKVIKLIDFYENFNKKNALNKNKSELLITDVKTEKNHELKKQFSTIKELGSFLRTQRLRHKLTRRFVAGLIGFNYSGITRLENGTNKNALTLNKKNNTYEKVIKLIDFYENFNKKNTLNKQESEPLINDINTNKNTELGVFYTAEKLGSYLLEERLKHGLSRYDVAKLNYGINIPFLKTIEGGGIKSIIDNWGISSEKALKLVYFYKKYDKNKLAQKINEVPLKEDIESKNKNFNIVKGEKLNTEFGSFSNVEELGKYLRLLRLKKKLTKSRVERDTGLNDTTIDWYERGWVKNALSLNFRSKDKIHTLLNYYNNVLVEVKQSDKLNYGFSTVKELGDYLLNLRLKHRLTRVYVALQAKVSYSYIFRIEKGTNLNAIKGNRLDTEAYSLIDFYEKYNKLNDGAKESVLEMKINGIRNLSIRLTRALNKAKIKTVHELINKSERELLFVRGISNSSINEIKCFLQNNNLKLRNSNNNNESSKIINRHIWDFNDDLDYYSFGLLSSFAISTIRDLTNLSEKDLLKSHFRYRERGMIKIRLFLKKHKLKLRGDA